MGHVRSDGESEGHYVCDVKCKADQSWYHTNDNHYPVPILTNDVTKNGLVILYRKK